MKKFFLKIRNKIEPSRHTWSQEKLIKRDLDAYERAFGYRFDINHPISFTEKIQWYNLFYKNPLLRNIVDKYSFKQYIKEMLGEGKTIPVYGCWENIEELKLDWDKLPLQFCLKSTISSEGKHIIPIIDKNNVDFKLLKKELLLWLDPKNTMLNSYCTGYFNTKPRILAEKYVKDLGNKLNDYKIFCFNGKPYFVYVAVEYQTGTDSSIVFYDVNWNKLDIQYGNHKNDTTVEKPAHFEKMLEYATILSKDFPFVRVDFFQIPNQLYIAEMTFYPGGGLTPYYPERVNQELGNMFILPGTD